MFKDLQTTNKSIFGLSWQLREAYSGFYVKAKQGVD